MPEHIFFHIVFLSQILLLSFYFPRKMLIRMRYVFDAYPPATHPKLYPKPFEYYKKARRNYKNMNLFILLAGLLLLGVLLGYSRSGKWDHVIATWYYFAQICPLILIEIWSLKYYKLMREANSTPTRKAELQPRRLFDFVSPVMLGVAILVYVAFAAFIIYMRQFDYPWFGGYGNIVGITGLNLFFAGIIAWNLYGKKRDPYQAYEDRRRLIELTVKSVVFVSIVATLKIAITIVLAALELRHLQPIVTSLYFQLIVVIGIGAVLRAFRIEDINFEVYKADPLVTNEKRAI